MRDPLLEILLPGLTIQGMSTNRTGTTERDKKTMIKIFSQIFQELKY